MVQRRRGGPTVSEQENIRGSLLLRMPKIIDLLLAHIDGSLEGPLIDPQSGAPILDPETGERVIVPRLLDSTQVRAAEVLLDRALPKLHASEIDMHATVLPSTPVEIENKVADMLVAQPHLMERLVEKVRENPALAEALRGALPAPPEEEAG